MPDFTLEPTDLPPTRRGRPAGSKNAKGKAKPSVNGALGLEPTLWQAADKMRNNMDPGEYKHVVLGLIFLKYISDVFEEKHDALLQELLAGDDGIDPEDRDEYLAERIFWVPRQARWDFLQANAKQPTIGKLIDDAMVAIEHDNPSLKGVLSKDYSRPSLDKQRLGELIDLIGTVGLGDKANRSKDILGRVYEYFLGQFASAEGKKGGQFCTPRSVVRVLVHHYHYKTRHACGVSIRPSRSKFTSDSALGSSDLAPGYVRPNRSTSGTS